MFIFLVCHGAVTDRQTDGQIDSHAGTFYYMKSDRPHARQMSRSFCNQQDILISFFIQFFLALSSGLENSFFDSLRMKENFDLRYNGSIH